MDAIRRTSTLRRVATTASLAALLLAPGTADAARAHKAAKPKSPVIKSVSPLTATVGQTLTIKGKNFRKGKGRNSVGFKRDGAPVVFIKSDVSTTKVMYVKLRAKLEKVLYNGAAARFHLRVLAGRFGKQYTSNKLSPMIKPRADLGGGGPTGPTGPNGNPNPAFDPAGPNGDCDGDQTPNKDENGDIDNDLLSDELENEIGTNGCDADSDDDTVLDSYEYKSAVDHNDDEYQEPNTSLAYPGQRSYPNPLFADADTDFDGDVLTLKEEHNLWVKHGRGANETFQQFADKHLNYSDGLQYSEYARCPASHPGCGAGDDTRRVPTLAADGYDKHAAFLKWAQDNGYLNIRIQLPGESWWNHPERDTHDIRNVNFPNDAVVSEGCRGERLYYDYDCDGYLSDDERDEDADGLTNYDESHGRMQREWWNGCYNQESGYDVAYEGTRLTDADSDADGVRDGADDQDHDDIPNMMELSRMDASVDLNATPPRPFGHNDTNGSQCTPLDGLDPLIPVHPDDYGKVQPFDPCDPAPSSRSCERHPLLTGKPDPNWWSLN